MEKIIVHAKFHTGHRQLGYPGKCKFVHGHTWQGTVTVSTGEFPRDELDMSLGTGLSKLAGRVVRIGHLGSFNDLMLAGTLCGFEMGLRLAGVPHKEGGVMAALNVLAPANRTLAAPV